MDTDIFEIGRIISHKADGIELHTHLQLLQEGKFQDVLKSLDIYITIEQEQYLSQISSKYIVAEIIRLTWAKRFDTNFMKLQQLADAIQTRPPNTNENKLAEKTQS